MVVITIEREHILVKFFFDMRILAIIKEFSGALYLKESQIWKLPISSLEKLEYMLKENNFNYKIDGKREEIKQTYLKTKLFPHQQDFLNIFHNKDTVFLGDEQGLGKSLQAICAASQRKYELGYKHCLVVVGVAGLKYNWKEEIEIHTNEKCTILGERLITRGKNKGQYKDGSTNDKIEHLESIPEEYFWIVNIETLRNKEFSKIAKNLCEKDIISMCIADEVHRMKNPTCEQGKGFLKVNPKSKIALTGTPLVNSPLDVFIILKWLGEETHTWTEFKEHYCRYGGFANQELIGYKDLKSIRNKLSKIMVRRLKKEVLDLPEKIYKNEYVVMGDSQTSIYYEVLESIKKDIDKIKLYPDPLTALIRLRQATGHTGILSTTVNESIKFERAVQIIEDALDSGSSVLVFSCWREIITRFSEYIKDFCPAVITGATKQEDRQKEINKFQNNQNCRVIIGTGGALGTGYTLTKAQTVILLDQPWNRATEDQWIDRTHRIGQTGTVNIFRLIAKGTIDEKIAGVVSGKGEMSDLLVDGKVTNGKEFLDRILI